MDWSMYSDGNIKMYIEIETYCCWKPCKLIWEGKQREVEQAGYHSCISQSCNHLGHERRAGQPVFLLPLPQRWHTPFPSLLTFFSPGPYLNTTNSPQKYNKPNIKLTSNHIYIYIYKKRKKWKRKKSNNIPCISYLEGDVVVFWIND